MILSITINIITIYIIINVIDIEYIHHPLHVRSCCLQSSLCVVLVQEGDSVCLSHRILSGRRLAPDAHCKALVGDIRLGLRRLANILEMDNFQTVDCSQF